MAQELLSIQTGKPGSSPVVLVNGDAATGYMLLASNPPDWGNAVWEPFFSGPRGTQGAQLAGAVPQNRPLKIPLAILADSTDEMHAAAQVLWQIDSELRRFGGTITWRSEGATYKQYFDVLSCSAQIANYDWLYRNRHYAVVELAPVCAPYLLGDPYDILDGFDTDTSADWTKDVNTAALQIGGGSLYPTTTGGARWRHTGRGYAYGDCQVTLKITTGATVTNYEADLMLTADTAGADTHFSAQLFGGNIRLVKFTAGAQTVLATTAFALAANTTYWLRIRREGRNLYAHVYTSEPTLLGTPAAGATAQLSVPDNLFLAFGHTGFRLTVVDTGERYDDFRVEPFLYGGALTGPLYTKTAPEEFPLRPSPVGDAPPLADLIVDHIGGSASPVFALAAWWRRPSVWNYVWNGDFEDDVDGWSVAAVAGVIGAATSIVRNTTAARNKYGTANAQIVCPATANTGASFKINRRFYQGRSYLVVVWASSASQTTAVNAVIGVSGDTGAGAPGTLSTTPTANCGLWAPTADRDGAYVGFAIVTATATTMNIDGVSVCEARPAPLQTGISNVQTSCVVTRIPDDWPSAPFLACVAPAVSSEIIRVEAINFATNTLTIARGAEGTTASIAASNDPIIPLPELRYQYEGKGAQPPAGVIEAESCDTGNLTTWAVTALSGTRLGSCLSATGIGGAGSAWADWLIDPNLLVPDDYAGNEFAVEVWARVLISNGLTNPTAILQLAPEPNAISGGFSPLYGGIRYAEEYGAAGKSLAGATTSGPYWRFTRLGQIRMVADRTSVRSRLGLLITWSAAITGQCKLDYLVLVPSNGRALSPTAKDPSSGYPYFLNSAAAEAAKTVRSDLSGALAKPPLPFYPDHGLGGSLIELPPGNIDTFLKLSSHVPDWQTLAGTDEQLGHTISAHWRVTPRFTLARSS